MDTYTDSPRATVRDERDPRRDSHTTAASDDIGKCCSALAGMVDAFETRLQPILLPYLDQAEGRPEEAADVRSVCSDHAGALRAHSDRLERLLQRFDELLHRVDL